MTDDEQMTQHEMECQSYDESFGETVNEYILEGFSSADAQELARRRLGPAPKAPECEKPEPEPTIPACPYCDDEEPF